MPDDNDPSRWRMPNHERQQKRASHEKHDDMYEFSKLTFGESDIKDRYDNILGPLTLFAPYSNEDDTESTQVELTRPITPIDKEIKQPPSTYNKLAKLVRRRITAKPEMEHLPVDDQKELAGIIMGEVNGIYGQLRTQVNHPFMTTNDNIELQRRIYVHIVTVCEQLFMHYIKKAQILNRRGVFSGPANMSRLKAQLALDASKFTDISTIRRYIVNDMREKSDGADETDSEMLQWQYGADDSKPAPLLSYRGMIEISRPKSKQKWKYQTTEENLKDIDKTAVELDTGKLAGILSDIPFEKVVSTTVSVRKTRVRVKFIKAEIAEDDEEVIRRRSKSAKKTVLRRKRSSDLTRDKLILGKSKSVPNLFKESLFEELGIIEEDRRSVMSCEDHTETDLSKDIAEKVLEAEKVAKAQPGTIEYIREDLEKLVGQPPDPQSNDAMDELPPLLQAITRPARHDGKAEVFKKQLQELEEREQARRKEESITIQPPTHPQPATIATRMPNQLVVKASDIRVSERVCMSTITLKKYNTVYNDLMDEVDATMVKKMDSNLFLGDEISEVYREIMKTVKKDHLDMETDPYVEQTAQWCNLTSCLPSHNLSKTGPDRLINKSLAATDSPPWGSEGLKGWAKTPREGGEEKKTRSGNKANKGRRDLLNTYLGDGYIPHPPEGEAMENMPPAVQDLMSRTYASWLAWWKETVNSDDYMKYLSTQESDFMGVCFHFYNSDGEDDDEEGQELVKSKSALIRQSNDARLLEEMKRDKAKFEDGLWNVNTVLMGGLGKEPVVPAEKVHIPTPPPETEKRIPVKKAFVKSKRTLRHEAREAQELQEELEELRLVPSTSGTRKKRRNTTNTVASRKEMMETYQTRLESVWSSLHMPDNKKLDMAIKYSSDHFYPNLEEAIEEWEHVTSLIVTREDSMGRLEQFEKFASDPNRFFEKGYRGSSKARLEEAKDRQSLHQTLELLAMEIKMALDKISHDFHDVVTYKGRPYIDKLQWDQTEMLYWLQEERKQQAADYEKKLKLMKISALGGPHLQPLSV